MLGGKIGIGELVMLFMVVLLLFGAKRLPEIGSSLGKGIREFKGSMREIQGELKQVEHLSDGSTGTVATRDSQAKVEEPRKLTTND
jgi:sec-independent protein translocase protein TatA